MYKIFVAALVVVASAGWSQAQTPAEEYGPPTTDINAPQNPGQGNRGGFMDAISQFKKPNIKWGLLELHPYYGVGGTYDSNIFLMPQSHVPGQTANGGKAAPVLGSWITENNFGLKTLLPLSPRHSLRLNYDFLWRDYVKNPALNNAVNQNLAAAYNYQGPAGFSGAIRDDYVNTTDPPFSEIVARAQRWGNTVAAQGEYSPDGQHLFAAVDASDTMDKYVSTTTGLRALLDRYTQAYGMKAGWRLSPATRIYAAYHRQVIHYTVHQATPKDNKGHLLDFGVEGRIAPKLTGRIQSGVQFRNYDFAVFNGAANYTVNWMVATNLTYTPLERTSIDLLLSRALQESTFAPSQYYVANIVGLSAKHKFPRKITGTLNMGVEFDQYPGFTPSSGTDNIGGPSGKRRDDLYQIGPGLDYDIQEWLRASASYLYRERFSLFSQQFGYADQLTSVKFSVLF